ncbi:MAG: HlyD family efflux transporter periplasmic adaptor subunit [Alphaproteobacteria bacterium]
MKRAIGIIVGAALLAALAWFALQPAGPDGPRPFLGYVEADSLLVASEQTGRLSEIAVVEGQRIDAAAPLFALDDEAATEAVREAAAHARKVGAQLQDLREAQQRPAQIDMLQASRRQAQAALDLSTAELKRQETLFKQGVIAEARLDQARTAYRRDRNGLAEVERSIEAARLPGRASLIAAAEAEVEVAAAALRQAEIAFAQRRVAAPKAGRVLDVLYRVGEVAAAGQPVIELLPPENLRVRFYVPQDRIAMLKHGDRVAIACDGCASDLAGEITYIAAQSEFTPPVIFSRQERAKLVFRAEARPLQTPELLRPGLPVEVRTR